MLRPQIGGEAALAFRAPRQPLGPLIEDGEVVAARVEEGAQPRQGVRLARAALPAIRERELGLPPAAGALLAAPGTSRLSGSRLEDYGGISPAASLYAVSHAGDYVVGEEFADLLFGTLPPEARALWWRQRADAAADTTLAEAIGEGHNEAYALDATFDTGYRNYTTRKALRIGRVGPIDTLLYWPLTDQLLAEARGDDTVTAIAEPHDYPMGVWSDGTLRRPLLVVPRDSLATLRRGVAGE